MNGENADDRLKRSLILAGLPAHVPRIRSRQLILHQSTLLQNNKLQLAKPLSSISGARYPPSTWVVERRNKRGGITGQPRNELCHLSGLA